MPAGPGEQLLTTLFADVHYYFADPASKPPHHRFAKGSYVYLYYNSNNYQTKLEVANHAGTPDQDAFYGYMHVVDVKYNHLQPTLVTLLVNAAVAQDQQTWHLPGYDTRGEQKYIYKIHTLDIYLWTEKDAGSFMAHLKSLLAADRLEIRNAPASQAPHPEHRDSMSPVVQQLEKTAIGTTFPPKTTSAVSAPMFPGPPTPHSEAASPRPAPAPLAYNPAAPAAPEPVTYREKTPPPPDDGTGTGLKAAQQYEDIPQPGHLAPTPSSFQSSAQTTPHNAYFSGPPQQPQQFPGPPPQPWGPPDPSSQGAPSNAQQSNPANIPPAQSPSRHTPTPSFGPMAASTIGPASPPPAQPSMNRASTFGPGQTQFASYNPQTQYANYPGSPGFHQQSMLPPTPSAPPAYTGQLPPQSPGLPPPPQGQPGQQQQTPLGGYSNYSYQSAQQPGAGDHNQHGGYTGNLHEQVYRPTEAEANAYPKIKRAQTSLEGTQKTSKLQDGVGKMEGKVGKLLSRLDKLY